MIGRFVAGMFSLAVVFGPLTAEACSPLPYTLTNGNPADATQVMANLNSLVSCLNASMASPPQGRLTLQSGVPVLITAQAAKTTIYYTPYLGSEIPIYDGTNLVPTTFAELSAATTDATKSPAPIGANKINDWFVWNDAGTIRLGHGPDWTNNTTRSAGTALIRVAGILLNNASITNGPAAQRGTYVGTTISDSSGALDWQYGISGTVPTRGFFSVWNAYNRREVATYFADTTSSYTYSGGVRQANGNGSNNQVLFVVGAVEDAIEASYSVYANQGANPVGAIGVNLNTTSSFGGPVGDATIVGKMTVGRFTGLPALGLNQIYALEASGAGQTLTVQSGGTNYIGGLSFIGKM